MPILVTDGKELVADSDLSGCEVSANGGLIAGGNKL